MDIIHKKIRSLTLKQIAYAVATADAGNVSLAARRLHVSQPAISTAIQALEGLFGHRIFTRHPGQGVTPTSFGATVLAEARALLEHVESFSSLGDQDELPRGQVVLCCYRILGPYVLPSLLCHLAETVPSVTVRFMEVDLDDVPPRLMQDNADMAISYDTGLDRSFEARTLFEEEARILCPADHPLAQQASVPLEVLAQEPLIVLDQPLSAQHLLGLLKAHAIEPHIAAQVTELELQRSMIAHGFGLGLSYTNPKTGLSYDGKPIVELPVSTPLPTERVMLIRAKQHRYHPAVTAVHDAILNHFGAAAA